MTVLEEIQKLHRYKKWANERMYDSCGQLSQSTAPTTCNSNTAGIVRMLSHVQLIDMVWKCHLEGTAHGFSSRQMENPPAMQELRSTQREIDDWYVNYCELLDGSALSEIVEFAFIDGAQGSMTRGEILFHVVNHTTYHRGGIVGLLSSCGVHPYSTDLTVFLSNT